jgi:protein SCO1/2
VLRRLFKETWNWLLRSQGRPQKTMVYPTEKDLDCRQLVQFLGRAVALLVLLASCSRAPENLPILGHVAPFRLTSQSGQDFDSARLTGHVWVADFIFTNCEGPCPRMSAYMRALQKATSDLPDLKMVSFTVDPARDTPPVLRAYGDNYNADSGRWYFLTGDPKILDALDHDSFKLGSIGSQMDHSTRFVLVDSKGQVRGYYGIGAGDPVSDLARDARQLEREKS